MTYEQFYSRNYNSFNPALKSPAQDQFIVSFGLFSFVDYKNICIIKRISLVL